MKYVRLKQNCKLVEFGGSLNSSQNSAWTVNTTTSASSFIEVPLDSLTIAYDSNGYVVGISTSNNNFLSEVLDVSNNQVKITTFKAQSRIQLIISLEINGCIFSDEDNDVKEEINKALEDNAKLRAENDKLTKEMKDLDDLITTVAKSIPSEIKKMIIEKLNCPDDTVQYVYKTNNDSVNAFNQAIDLTNYASCNAANAVANKTVQC